MQRLVWKMAPGLRSTEAEVQIAAECANAEDAGPQPDVLPPARLLVELGDLPLQVREVATFRATARSGPV